MLLPIATPTTGSLLYWVPLLFLPLLPAVCEALRQATGGLLPTCGSSLDLFQFLVHPCHPFLTGSDLRSEAATDTHRGRGVQPSSQ